MAGRKGEVGEGWLGSICGGDGGRRFGCWGESRRGYVRKITRKSRWRLNQPDGHKTGENGKEKGEFIII